MNWVSVQVTDPRRPVRSYGAPFRRFRESEDLWGGGWLSGLPTLIFLFYIFRQLPAFCWATWTVFHSLAHRPFQYSTLFCKPGNTIPGESPTNLFVSILVLEYNCISVSSLTLLFINCKNSKMLSYEICKNNANFLIVNWHRSPMDLEF